MSKYSIVKVSNRGWHVVHKNTGLKHSLKPQTSYSKARALYRALNSIDTEKPLSKYDEEGAGFLDSLKSAAKNWRFDLFIFVIQAIKDIKSRLQFRKCMIIPYFSCNFHSFLIGC